MDKNRRAMKRHFQVVWVYNTSIPMNITIYHNPRCSKSRQTLTLLEEHGHKPTIVDYLKTPPGEKELSDILSKLGLTPRELMRTKEPEYKDNKLDTESLSEQELITAMIKFPKLIERPVVVTDKKAAIGRPPENVLTILS